MFTCIHDVYDFGNCDGSFGDVGGEDYFPDSGDGIEDVLLHCWDGGMEHEDSILGFVAEILAEEEA
jgi:hypothetical protein